jgi:hypothetical protein
VNAAGSPSRGPRHRHLERVFTALVNQVDEHEGEDLTRAVSVDLTITWSLEL